MKLKNIVFTITTMAAVLLGGCKPDEDVAPSSCKLFVETLEKTCEASTGNTITVEATADVSWTASVAESCDWLVFTKATGTGSGKAIFSVKENTVPVLREASVVFTATSSSNSSFAFNGTVLVKQSGAEAYISVVPADELRLTYEACAASEITVTSNVEWNASVEILSGDAGWLTVTAPKTAVTGNGTVTISATENSTETMRQAKLIITATDNSKEVVLPVNQQRFPAQYYITIAGMSDYLPEGDGKVAFVSASKTTSNIDASVYYQDGATVINYQEPLAAGDYVIENVTMVGGSTYPMGCKITVDTDHNTTYVEQWVDAFKVFGGESVERAIEIASAADLSTLAKAVNDGVKFSAVYFKQTKNISLDGYSNWGGIGSAAHPFAGIYDGNGKSVSKLAIAMNAVETATVGEGEVTCGYALFRHVAGVSADSLAVIKNLTVEGNGGTAVDLVSSVGYVSGLVAKAAGYTLIQNCVNKANIEFSLPANGPAAVGGLVQNAFGGDIVIENCSNYGTINVTVAKNCNGVGGIVGQIQGSAADSRARITGCKNHAKIIYNGNTGGIVGAVNNFSDIERCANFGAIERFGLNNLRVGAIIGSMIGDDITVRECYNTANLKLDRNSGALIGWCASAGLMKNCYNTGSVECRVGTGNTGGLVGNITASALNIVNCFNVGSVVSLLDTDKNLFGAIAGSANSLTSGVSGCYYQTGVGMVGGLGAGANGTPADAAGKAEGKEASWFTSGSAIEGWDTAVWNFVSGQYPDLKNNSR